MAGPVSPALRHIFDNGNRVGEKARQEFPGGVLVDANHTEPERAVEQTVDLMDGNALAIYEAAFVADATIVRVDVLPRTPTGWRLVEVKSTTGVKPHNIWDVAVQLHVVQQCGVPLESASLMHLSKEFIYPDLGNLFVEADLTESARECLPDVGTLLERFSTLISNDCEPAKPVGSHCNDPFECPFKPYCWRDVPRQSIFTIPRLKKSVSDELAAKGTLAIEDLPEDAPLSASGRAYVEMVRRGVPVIDVPAIREQVAGLIYPLHFLDFETAGDPIPRLSGLSPYSPYPFQYSLHILTKDEKLVHREYLHEETSDPRHQLAESLCSDVGSTGTLIAYNAGFEKGKIRDLAEFVRLRKEGGTGPAAEGVVTVDLADQLLAMLPRFFDLLDIFRHHYAHPDFLGSNSIKSVLPVLVSELRYNDLEISDGGQAQAVWSDAIGLNDSTEKSKTMTSLREYCKLDTLAMVRIYEVLLELGRATATVRDAAMELP